MRGCLGPKADPAELCAIAAAWNSNRFVRPEDACSRARRAQPSAEYLLPRTRAIPRELIFIFVRVCADVG
jgi:hypothetical protein